MTVLDWFVPLSASPWLVTLTVAALVVLSLGGIVAHWPRRFPGPLTAAERANALRSGPARWGRVALPFALASAAFVGSVLLLCPPRRPVDLVLASRLRVASAACPELDAAASERPRMDLGPSVDRALTACRDAGATAWVRGTAGERELARQTMLTTLDDFDPPRQSPSRAEAHDLPPWLVRSVEQSVTALALRRLNAKDVRVAAGAEAPADWPLASEILNKRTGVPVRLVDGLSPPPAGPRVRRLTAARLAGKELTAWAVVEGLPKAGAVKLKFRLVATGGRVELPEQAVDVGQAGLACRLVPLKFALPTPPKTDGALTLTDETGRCRTPVWAQAEVRSPRLRIVAAEATAWADGLLAASKDASAKAESDAMGQPLPVVDGGSDFVLLVRDGRAALGASEATCRWALEQPTQGADGKSARVTGTRLEPGTVFSWLALPVLGPTKSGGGEPAVTTDRAEGGREWLVGVGQFEGKSYVVLQGEAAKSPALSEPWRSSAQARTLAWACRYVGEPASASASAAAQVDADWRDPPPCPLLTEADLDRLTAAHVAGQDATIVGVVGLYLTSLTWRVYRALPRR